MTDQRITDFAVWDIQDEFTPNEAAYLWLGLEPSHAIGGRPAKVISLSNTLFSEVKKGVLPARQGDPRLWEGPYIKRESLKAWAERKGQQPLFLFPECRQTISISENGQQDLPPESPPVSLSDAAMEYRQSLPVSENDQQDRPPEKAPDPELSNNREQGSVIKLLDALLSLNYGREWYKRDIELVADEFIEELSQKGIDEPLERRAILRWFAKVKKKAASNDQ